MKRTLVLSCGTEIALELEEDHVTLRVQTRDAMSGETDGWIEVDLSTGEIGTLRDWLGSMHEKALGWPVRASNSSSGS